MGKRTFKQGGGAIMVTTTITPYLWEKANEHGIKWSEALRVGISQILSNIGDPDFINPMQQQKKIELLASKVEELARENLSLREKYGGVGNYV